MRVAPRDEAGAAGAARTGRDEGPVESHPLSGQSVDVRRPDLVIPVGTAVVPCHVVGDDQDDVGALQPYRGREADIPGASAIHLDGDGLEDGFHRLTAAVIAGLAELPTT